MLVGVLEQVFLEEVVDVLRLIADTQVVCTQLLATADLILRLLHIPDVEEDRDGFARSRLPQHHGALYPSHSVHYLLVLPLLARHVGDEDNFGSGVFQEGLILLQPVGQVLRGEELDQDGGLVGYLDHVEDLASFLGLVVDPEHEVGVDFRHRFLGFDFLEVVDLEVAV